MMSVFSPPISSLTGYPTAMVRVNRKTKTGIYPGRQLRRPRVASYLWEWIGNLPAKRIITPGMILYMRDYPWDELLAIDKANQTCFSDR